MMTPPCFVVGPNATFWLEENAWPQQKTTPLGVMSGQFSKITAYDASGHKRNSMGVDSSYQRTWWRVLLAHTVYNPWITVDLKWGDSAPFELKELKRAYSHAVDLDDDNLTQFVDAPELKERIELAHSFDELVEVYRWMQTDSTSVCVA